MKAERRRAVPVTEQLAPRAGPLMSRTQAELREEFLDLLGEALVELALSACLDGEAERECPTRRA